jgi:tetratricopeptide (TPR) repeat protein
MRLIALVVLVVLTMAGSVFPAHASQPSTAASDADATYYFMLGRYLESQGKIEEAITAHKQAIAAEPKSAGLRAELAGLYARQDKALESLEMAESALQQDPDNREANRILGTIYAAFISQPQPIRPGDNPAQYGAKAVAALEKAREPNTLDVGLELTLGRLYVQTGAFAKAVPALQRVVADQPQFLEAAFLLSAAQEGTGRVDDATTTIEEVIRQNPGYYRGQLRVAELYERQQRWQEAADAYGRAQKLNARATGLTTRRAAALINAGKSSEARDLLQPAVSARGDAPDPMQLYLLAEAYRATKDLPAAEKTARRLLDTDAKDSRGLHVMSQILQDKGDIPGAERMLRELIASDPLDSIALNSLGYMLAERRDRLDEAVTLLQRALKVEPDNPSYLDSLGWAYFQQGRVDLADAPLTEAAEKLTTSSVVQDHLGDLRFRQQRYSDAAQAWQRALDGDGQSIDRAKIEQKLREARSKLESR